MKCIFILAALAATLGVTPSIAQQGPAGVPGAFGLAESVTSAQSPPPAQKSAPAAADCSKAKNVEQCKARQEARKKALEACRGKTGTQRKQCLNEQAQNVDCKKSSDPARCAQFERTRKLCATKTGEEYRQCLRDNLAPKK